MTTPPDIIVTDRRLDRAELARLVQGRLGNMVKFVVDIRRRVLALGGELHADGERDLASLVLGTGEPL
jgi:hypothetical protein